MNPLSPVLEDVLEPVTTIAAPLLDPVGMERLYSYDGEPLNSAAEEGGGKIYAPKSV